MKLRAGFAFGVALLAVLAAGLYLGGHPGKLPTFAREAFVSDSTALSAEAAEAIEDNYYRAAGPIELGNASVQGMVRELRRRHGDRFSDYFSPESLEAFDTQIEGRFSGIGLSIVPVKRGLYIVKVYARSPAAEGGLEVGDTVVSVGGESLRGVDSSEATQKIKGPEGTTVTIGVLDAKTHKIRELTLTRAEVELPNVSSHLFETDGIKVGYVRMLSFSEGSSDQLDGGIAKVQKEGAEALLIDLRGNPGGLLEEAVSAASLFLPPGELVVSTKSRTEGDSSRETEPGQLTKLPAVVLIDRNTASASEILAAALADDADSTIVGTRSFGKGVFQQEVQLANGGALKLTVGEFFTPDGKNLARTKGVHPDIHAVDDPATPVDEARRRALEVAAEQAAG